jgi:son of sevenless-like protein
LVNCAKAASGLHAEVSEAPRTEEDDDRDMEELAKSARAVFAGVKRFLNLAGTFGVEAVAVADADESIPPFLTTTDAAPGPSAPRTPSGGNARIQETFKKRAASIGDLRAARRRQSSPPPPMPSTAGLDTSFSSQISRSRSPSVTTPLSASFASTASGRSSPMSDKQYRGGRRVQGSMDSGFSHSAASSDGEFHGLSPYPQDPTLLHTPILGSRVDPDVAEQINLAEDALLSIIAAFIGHIHSHHIGSHPSSHATLIEMTRQTIDAVRELLTIVEGIGRTATIRAVRPREVESLRQAKDQLYDVASRLVEGAEAVANAAPADQGDEHYDKDKAKLLQSATGTLRAGAECVRLVRLCTPDPSTPNSLSTPRQGDNVSRHHTPRPNQEAGLVRRDYPVGQRGEHTLSGLHRKATSLSYLQQRYQQDGSMVHATPEEEERDEDGEDDEEVVADLSREEDMTVKPLEHLAPPLQVRGPTVSCR